MFGGSNLSSGSLSFYTTLHSLLRVFASSVPAHTSSVYKAAYQVASIKTHE